MFAALGRFVATRWGWLLPAWALLTVGVLAVRPAWEDVTADGEFAFLPDDVPSREAEDLFREAFTGDLLRSSVVLVVRRPRGAGLRPEDDAFLEDRLYPALRETLVSGGFAAPDLTVGGAGPAGGEAGAAAAPAPGAKVPLVRQAATASDRVVGSLFASDDGKAKLVVLGLGSEFGEARNVPLVAAVETLVADLTRSGAVPPGLELKLSGTAVVGRDTRLAEFRSAEATHLATVVLVVGLLLVIYRAPLLALVPLATVYLSVEIALGLLGLAAGAGWFAPFAGLEIYVTVVTYGAGVDYCMFLTARYREEVDRLGAGPAGGGRGGPRRRRLGRGAGRGGGEDRPGPDRQRGHDGAGDRDDGLRGVRQVPPGGRGDLRGAVRGVGRLGDVRAGVPAGAGAAGVLAEGPAFGPRDRRRVAGGRRHAGRQRGRQRAGASGDCCGGSGRRRRTASATGRAAGSPARWSPWPCRRRWGCSPSGTSPTAC